MSFVRPVLKCYGIDQRQQLTSDFTMCIIHKFHMYDRYRHDIRCTAEQYCKAKLTTMVAMYVHQSWSMVRV